MPEFPGRVTAVNLEDLDGLFQLLIAERDRNLSMANW